MPTELLDLRKLPMRRTAIILRMTTDIAPVNQPASHTTQPPQCMQSTQCMQRRGIAESAATPAFILRAFRPPPTPDNFTTDVRHQRRVPLPPLASSSAMRSTMINIVDSSPRKIHDGLRTLLKANCRRTARTNGTEATSCAHERSS